MKIKLAFELNKPCPNTGVIYDGKFLEKLDIFIKDYGFVMMHNESKTYTKNDLIGVATNYDILKGVYVIINVHQINERFNALNNVDGYLNGLPRVVGSIDDNGIAIIDRIESIEVMV